MWEQLEKYRNHYLQREINTNLKTSTINRQQEKEWTEFMEKRDWCKCYPKSCPGTSTYFDDRAQLAYGWFALPKLLQDMNSDCRLTHWRALTTLSEFLLNPLNAQRAITEMEIVRKVQNAFLRIRLNFYQEQYRETEAYLKIYNILSRDLNGAEQIARRKCLMLEFYKILKDKKPYQEDLAAEILRNLSSKPKVLGIVLQDSEYYAALANIFLQDPCQPLYPQHLWHHLCHLLEVDPVQGIKLGFFEFLHSRIANRLPKYWDLTSKAFAMLLRCAEGQTLFDKVDGIKLIYEVLLEVNTKDKDLLPMQKVEHYEFVMLALLQGLHSKRALWRSREFTLLVCYVGRLARGTVDNPQLQLYCLKIFRVLGMMPCIKRYIITNWLTDLQKLSLLNADAECARDELVHWLTRDIAAGHL